VAKLLYVVHRYAPFPGGSEYNTKRYAEASVKLGHDTWVLSPINMGDLNGVKVSNNISLLSEKWDLIIVHGDASVQNIVHHKQVPIISPVFHLLIRPNENSSVLRGMENSNFIGCATTNDEAFVKKHGHSNKIRYIRYAIDMPVLESKKDIRNKINVSEKTKLFFSAGGFAKHKGMQELISTYLEYEKINGNSLLVLFGYDTNHGYPTIPNSIFSKVHMYYVEDHNEIYNMMRSSDLYIWNSSMQSEGYGLVLLESMYCECPWIGINDAVGKDLADKGKLNEAKGVMIRHNLNSKNVRKEVFA